jgi:hypothetical protein
MNFLLKMILRTGGSMATTSSNSSHEEWRRVLELLDRLDGRLDTVDQTLVRNTVSLEEHIKRTNMLEEHVKGLEKELTPVHAHVSFMNSVFKIGSVLLTLLLAAKSLKII